jgi:hypothetical protein
MPMVLRLLWKCSVFHCIASQCCSQLPCFNHVGCIFLVTASVYLGVITLMLCCHLVHCCKANRRIPFSSQQGMTACTLWKVQKSKLEHQSSLFSWRLRSISFIIIICLRLTNLCYHLPSTYPGPLWTIKLISSYHV